MVINVHVVITPDISYIFPYANLETVQFFDKEPMY